MRRCHTKLRVERLEDRHLLAIDFQLLADVNSLLRPVGADPASIVEMDGIAYFRAMSPTQGIELWRSDGTAEGTRLVKGILPGIIPREHNDRYQLFPSNGTLFFGANDGSSGYELWKSDGTESGTVRVKDLNPGAEGSYPFQFAEVNGTVVFSTRSGELWKTDGTEVGTRWLADFSVPFGAQWIVNDLTSTGDRAYFIKTTFGPFFDTFTSLWSTDGSTTSPVSLATDYVAPQTLTNANGTLYFAANGRQLELFAVPPGTDEPVSLTGEQSGVDASVPQDLANVQGTLYFSAVDDRNSRVLFTSDGTVAGTTAVVDTNGAPFLNPQSVTEVAGAAYFTAFASGASAPDLWFIASSGATPHRIPKPATDPPQTSPHWQELSNLTNVSGQLYFHAYDPSSQFSLWKTDGTEVGTILIQDEFGTLETRPRFASQVNGNLYFASTFPPGPGGDTIIRDLWMSDGTTEGTTAVLPYVATADGSPSDVIDVAGRLFFTAQTGLRAVQRELWTTDGTAEGTRQLTFLPSTSDVFEKKELTNVTGTLYFVVESPFGGELWKSDGTVEGTVPIKSWSDAPAALTNLDGTLVFLLETTTEGAAVWTSNGTADGTQILHHIGTDGGFGPSPNVVQSQGVLYFRANDGTHGYELWKSNGTSDGTMMVKDIRQGPLSAFASGTNLIDFQPVIHGGNLYFAANDGRKGVELWKSDGTSSGTVLVKDLRPGSSSYGSDPSYLTAAGEFVYFRAYSGGVYALWRTDGTAEGTIRLTSQSLIDPPSEFPSPDRLVNIDGIVYFTQHDNEHGLELWRSYGTPEGTHLVKDLAAGPFSSSPTQLVNLQGTLYFSAVDPDHGHELWRSDGTAAGTYRAHDFTSDNGSSNPSQITWWNDRIIVAATTDAFGRELWIGEITQAIWHNAQLPTDVNGDGVVSPLDALLVINELIDRAYSDGESGQLDETIVSPPYFLDVNNDRIIAPIDALLVINQLPSTDAAQEGQAPMSFLAVNLALRRADSLGEDREPQGQRKS